MSEFDERLSNMQRTWTESKNRFASMFGGESIPAGDYIALLRSARLKASKSSDKLMVAREHIITEGEYKGFIVYDYLHLETEYGPVFLRRWIEQMGYECPNEYTDLPVTVEAIEQDEATVKIKVTHSGDFTNVQVLELLSTAPADEVLGVENVVEDAGKVEEIPSQEELNLPTPETEDIAPPPPEEEVPPPEEEVPLPDDELEKAKSEPEVEPKSAAATRAEAVEKVKAEAKAAAKAKEKALEKAKPEPKPKAEPKAEPEKKVKAKKPTKKQKEVELLPSLAAFCEAQNIPVEEPVDYAAHVTAIDEFEYYSDELTPEQAELLDAIGLKGNILAAEQVGE